VHHDRGSRARIQRSGGTKLRNFDNVIRGGQSLRRETGALLAKQQNAPLRQRHFFHRYRALHVIDGHQWERLLLRKLKQVVDGRVMQHMLVAVGDHGATFIPASAPDNVDRVGKKRVCAPDNRPDIQVVLPVLNRDMEAMAASVEIRDDGFHRPIAVLINHIARVAVGEEFCVKMIAFGPRPRPGAHSMRGFFGVLAGVSHLTSLGTNG